jgi:hypothetical protein
MDGTRFIWGEFGCVGDPLRGALNDVGTQLEERRA